MTVQISRRAVLGLIAAGVFVSLFALYAATAATGIIPGDPTEYTFVAHILGIAHPPGYAFMVLLTKLWQTLVPIGTIARRSHLLAATTGATTGVLTFGMLWRIGSRQHRPGNGGFSLWVLLFPALAGALGVAWAADQWQHSIHTNSHIVTVTLNALALLALLSWWRTGRDRWLYAFCLVAGMGVTHHPLTAFSFPAYALFILLVRPALIQMTSREWWRERHWRTLIFMLLFALMGLSIWLYFPIRSPMEPLFGPHDMNTWDGFLNLVLARGLRVNLFHFGLGEQGQRLLVFWSLLRQQFPLVTIALAGLGLIWLVTRRANSADGRSSWRVAVLLGGALLANLAFIINSVQDVMAYLLTPFMLVGLLAGVGGIALLDAAHHLWQARNMRLGSSSILELTLGLALMLWPVSSLIQNAPVVSLRDYRAGDAYVNAVDERFVGHGEGAVLLNDWEHMTTLWYKQFVIEQPLDPTDVVPGLVSPDRPWVQRVFDHLPGGPVYLSGYRREVVDIGFRLRPEGPFYQVVEPGESSLPDHIQPLQSISDQPIELLGYWLPTLSYTAGDIVALDLAMSAPVTPTDYLVPYVQLGHLNYPFTTDSHLLTPWWQPGEVIIERFSFALPQDLKAGPYPLRVGLANLSAGIESNQVSVAEITVASNLQAPEPDVLDNILANFGQRVGVDQVHLHSGGERRSAVWDKPLLVSPAGKLDLVIKWRCLAPVEESYTVFVHLMDAGNQVLAQQDYTPLGGSYPTNLWFPKWLPGQTALDPYRLIVPPNTPPGVYYVEIGLYGMTSRQRIYQYDRAGNLVGDRLVLGPVQIP